MFTQHVCFSSTTAYFFAAFSTSFTWVLRLLFLDQCSQSVLWYQELSEFNPITTEIWTHFILAIIVNVNTLLELRSLIFRLTVSAFLLVPPKHSHKSPSFWDTRRLRWCWSWPASGRRGMRKTKRKRERESMWCGWSAAWKRPVCSKTVWRWWRT